MKNKIKYSNIICLTYLIFNYNLHDSFLTMLSFFGVDYTDFLQSVDHQLMSKLLPFEHSLDK